jgi:hypothetical protein
MKKMNHIAILVRDIDVVSNVLPRACTLHTPEDQPTEGTRERYVTVGGEDTPALLLMEAIADGPYSRALRKRGPGLHHIGCVCEDIEREITEGNTQRLLLHPISLRTRKFGVVWLCRPGVPYLVELMQNPEESAKSYGKAIIRLPVGTAIPQFASALSPNLIIEAGNSPAIGVNIGGIEISLDPRMG